MSPAVNFGMLDVHYIPLRLIIKRLLLIGVDSQRGEREFYLVSHCHIEMDLACGRVPTDRPRISITSIGEGDQLPDSLIPN